MQPKNFACIIHFNLWILFEQYLIFETYLIIRKIYSIFDSIFNNFSKLRFDIRKQGEASTIRPNIRILYAKTHEESAALLNVDIV